jgi:Bor protein
VKINRIVMCVGVVLLVGCANTRFNVGGEVSTSSNPKYEERQTYFVDGLGQRQNVDASKLCGGAEKVLATATETTFLDGFLRFLTSGVYSPETARVYCK